MTDDNRKMVVVISTINPNDYVEVEALQHYCLSKGFSFFNLIVTDTAKSVMANIRFLKNHEKNIHCIISMVHYGLFTLGANNVPFYDYIRVPFVLYALDPLALFYKHLEGTHLDRVSVFLHDAEEERHFKKQIFSNTNTILCEESRPVNPVLIGSEPTFEGYQSKDNLGVIAMNYDHNGIVAAASGEFFKDLSTIEKQVAFSMIEMCLDDTNVHIWDAFNTACRQNGVEIKGKQAFVPFHTAFAYLKTEERKRILNEFLDHPVLFLGKAFPDELTKKYPDKFMPIFGKNSFEVLKRSKVTISIGSAHWRSSNTRINAGVLVGSAVMAEETDYNKSLFKNDSLHLYNFEQGNASQVLSNILEDDYRAFEKVQSAYKTVIEDNLIFAAFDKLMQGVDRIWEER